MNIFIYTGINVGLYIQIYICKWASQLALVVKNLPVDAGDARDTGSIPGSGRYSGEGKGSPPQYFCLESSMDRGAWWATVYGVSRSWTRLSELMSVTCTHPVLPLFESDQLVLTVFQWGMCSLLGGGKENCGWEQTQPALEPCRSVSPYPSLQCILKV